MKVVYSSGNLIVDEVGKIQLMGNIIPEAWYHTVVNENGKPNLLAINILADIVYWYRPTEIRDEKSGNVTYKKKFYDKDFLQKSYADICNKFNCSEKQVREALKLLENLEVVQRHFKAVMTGYGKLPNIMFLELFPETLKKLTFPSGNTCFPFGKDVVPDLETPIAPDGNTITKNTTEITTAIYTPIPNHMDKEKNQTSYSHRKYVNQFNNYPQRDDYDFEELERRLVKN